MDDFNVTPEFALQGKGTHAYVKKMGGAEARCHVPDLPEMGPLETLYLAFRADGSLHAWATYWHTCVEFVEEDNLAIIKTH